MALVHAWPLGPGHSNGLTADFSVVDPQCMMCTYAPVGGPLLNRSYMHGVCGSISTQYAVRTLPIGILGRSCPKNGPKGAQALHTKMHYTADAQVRNFWSVDPVF